jgi:hypothetical protein
MSGKYVAKEVTPPLDEFRRIPEASQLKVEPAVELIGEQESQ